MAEERLNMIPLDRPTRTPPDRIDKLRADKEETRTTGESRPKSTATIPSTSSPKASSTKP